MTLERWSLLGDMAYGKKNPSEDRYYLHPPSFWACIRLQRGPCYPP